MSDHEILELQTIDEAPAPRAALALAENSPAAVMLAALDRGISPENIEKMMALQERWEANEARKAFARDLAAFKGEAIEIIKRKPVDFANKSGGRTSYKHAELFDVIEAVGPALSKHGFSWSFDTRQSDRWLDVTCILRHQLGHFETVTLGGPPDESGGKNTIQAWMSTKTYLERHTLKAICGVAEKGEDNDGNGGKKGDTGGGDTILQTGREKAMEGSVALAAWWDAIGKQERKRLANELPGLRRASEEADRARG
jgi:hypothetical protein